MMGRHYRQSPYVIFERLTVHCATVAAFAIIALGMNQNTGAGIVNGDFEDGLAGWTVSSGSWTTFAGSGGDHVALSDTGGVLSQDFSLPIGAQTIEFDTC